MSSIRQQSRLFQALSEPVRLRLVALLAASKERACVCELADALDEPEYNVSRHLKILEDAGLAVRIREGRWIYYRFAPPLGRSGRYLSTVLKENADEQLAVDRRRFDARLALRKDGQCVIWKIERLPVRARPRAVVRALRGA